MNMSEKGKLLLFVFLSLFVLTTAGGCSGSSLIKRDSPDIRGTITRIDVVPDEARQNGTVLDLLVEGKKDVDTMYDRARVVVRVDTVILFDEGDGFTAISHEDLKVGQVVEIWFTGPRLTSLPILGVSKEIRVIRMPF